MSIKGLISTILSIALIMFLCKACNSEKDVLEYTLDTVSGYYHYADSVFNGK